LGAVITLIGIAILGAFGVGLLGGVVLRVTGITLAASGVLGLVLLGNPIAALLAASGLVAWLAGHWHHAFRYHAYKSPLARRIFLQMLPSRYDPTRGWGTPAILPDPPPCDSQDTPFPENEGPVGP